MSNKNNKVLVLNSDKTFLKVFERALEEEGFDTSTGRLPQLIEKGEVKLRKFINNIDPGVVIWDIDYPYEKHWKYYKKMHQLEEFSDMYFIPVTTGGESIKKKYSEDKEVLAIIDKPFDMTEMVDTLRTGIKLGKLNSKK